MKKFYRSAITVYMHIHVSHGSAHTEPNGNPNLLIHEPTGWSLKVKVNFIRNVGLGLQ
jgi:hypothetical protein